MARIVEETVTIKISKLVRDQDADASLISEEFVLGIEAMASELVGDPAAVVEVVVDG